MLTAKDIEFLSRKTKLNPSRAQSLFEEKEDGDLVLQQLSKKRITKKEVLELSFPIFIKLLINREMKDVDQKYKNYILIYSFIILLLIFYSPPNPLYACFFTKYICNMINL